MEMEKQELLKMNKTRSRIENEFREAQTFFENVLQLERNKENHMHEMIEKTRKNFFKPIKQEKKESGFVKNKIINLDSSFD